MHTKCRWNVIETLDQSHLVNEWMCLLVRRHIAVVLGVLLAVLHPLSLLSLNCG